jgi:hypothetical protein
MTTDNQPPAKPCIARVPSDEDLGVLVALAEAARRFRIGREREFVRPMDVAKGSSKSLERLEKLGLAVCRPRDLKYSAVLHPSRVHREYKITEAGLAAARDYDSRINSSLTCSHVRGVGGDEKAGA